MAIRRGDEEVTTCGELLDRAGRALSALGVGSGQRALLVLDDTLARPTMLLGRCAAAWCAARHLTGYRGEPSPLRPDCYAPVLTEVDVVECLRAAPTDQRCTVRMP